MADLHNRLKKEHDLKNIHFKEVLYGDGIDESKAYRTRLFNNLRADVARMEGFDKKQQIDNRVSKIERKAVNREREILKNPEYSSMLHQRINNDAVNSENLIYPRTLNLIKMRNRETEGQPMPEPFRDIDEEMTQDDLIASLNNILTEKARDLEYVMGSFGDTSTQIKRSPFESFVNNGKLLSSYNSLMRAYLKPTLAKSSKVVLANKIQQLEPLFKTIEYGIHQLIIDIYDRAGTKGIQARPTDLLSLLKCEAVYRAIKESIYQRSYKIIDEDVINFTIRDVVRGYPDRVQVKLFMVNDNPTPVFKYDLKNTDADILTGNIIGQIKDIEKTLLSVASTINTEEKNNVGREGNKLKGQNAIADWKNEIKTNKSIKTGRALSVNDIANRRNAIAKTQQQILGIDASIRLSDANIAKLKGDLKLLTAQKDQLGKSL